MTALKAASIVGATFLAGFAVCAGVVAMMALGAVVMVPLGLIALAAMAARKG